VSAALGLGALPTPEGVRFQVWAPHARRVSVRVPGEALERVDALEELERGYFAGTLADLAAGADYRLRLDDRFERPDPASRHQPDGVHGASRVVDPEAFAWTDTGWRGIDRPDLVLYELHVGTFTGAGTFDAAIGQLGRLRELGITAIELMPIAQFPGTRNWGYDGVFPYAPQDSYGGPEGLRRLVDAAHRTGLAVLLDVVYNHLGPEGNVLGDFGPYFTERYRTAWGSALNFDGPASDEVRRYFIENALHWISEYHLDGLRLDAVHAIHDASAHPFLAELAEAVHGLARRLDRVVHLTAESDANDPRLVRDPDRGGLGLDAVWNDDFHHAVHAALTGERIGYYADFGGVESIAKAWSDRFVYDGAFSRDRQRRHGAPARDIPADRFVVCVQNHDQVGNRAGGERLAKLLPPARQRLAAALLLLTPYIPLLFMGEEYGETAPFLYFVDHGDRALLDAVRRGRREEFARFAWRTDVPDPAAVETFERSRLQPERCSEPGHRELLALYRELLRVRSDAPALRPGRCAVRVDADPPAGWLAARLTVSHDDALLAGFQLGPAKQEVSLPDGDGSWRLRLTTDDTAFGGSGRRVPERLQARGGRLHLLLAPESAVLYARET